MVLTHQPPYVLGNQVEVQRDRKKVEGKEDDADDEKRSANNSSLSSYISIQ